jgi:hypothetical protein
MHIINLFVSKVCAQLKLERCQLIYSSPYEKDLIKIKFHTHLSDKACKLLNKRKTRAG